MRRSMSYNYGKPLLRLAEIVHSKSCAEDFPNRELLKQIRKTAHGLARCQLTQEKRPQKTHGPILRYSFSAPMDQG